MRFLVFLGTCHCVLAGLVEDETTALSECLIKSLEAGAKEGTAAAWKYVVDKSKDVYHGGYAYKVMEDYDDTMAARNKEARRQAMEVSKRHMGCFAESSLNATCFQSVQVLLQKGFLPAVREMYSLLQNALYWLPGPLPWNSSKRLENVTRRSSERYEKGQVDSYACLNKPLADDLVSALRATRAATPAPTEASPAEISTAAHDTTPVEDTTPLSAMEASLEYRTRPLADHFASADVPVRLNRDTILWLVDNEIELEAKVCS